MLPPVRQLLLLSMAVASVAIAATTPRRDLPLGELEAIDRQKGWGAAFGCKPVPSLPELVAPLITISIEGRTLHLEDEETGYDRVFPVGVGELVHEPGAWNDGESHSYEPVLLAHRDTFELDLPHAEACRIWWTDPDSGDVLPVFAGLPFLPFYGNYGIHGPVTGFWETDGGHLVRGFVSHGCIRMRSEDVLELYARVRNAGPVPVRIVRPPERRPDGTRVDVADRWFGEECEADADCAAPGAICRANPVGGRRWCTAPCADLCPDRQGDPMSACIADPADPDGGGICVPRAGWQNGECASYDHFVHAELPRAGRAAAIPVCVPGTRGWIGDRCSGSDDCRDGLVCLREPEGTGICTARCETVCPDEPGRPRTACAADPVLGPTCLRRCDPTTFGADCASGTRCELRTRGAEGGSEVPVCVPRSALPAGDGTTFAPGT